ncbi:positive regulator of sigma E activity [Microbacteriaceae bacterium SG_E_30_P1]|uniref:Positive regulator of sigma E activity n=1 Tax=Antiquaquibacter oligotrophicus TaxID=2880260 RepID=A0ABT6KJQ1_9MICO|nr:hypothetical protein [Antiquaquibacter oligotrophicus]MDH6180224.1 positive regulator of sigma E activity [Antiquaquibacter oligotrophicus]UDF14029.1 hypothetical protein LH407_03995 [Antiquaquibacter oligotrophicus]
MTTTAPEIADAPALADTPSTTTVPILLHWAWSPVGLMLLLPLPALVAALTVPDDYYVNLWGQPLFVTADIKLQALLYSAVILGVFVSLQPLIRRSGQLSFSPAQVQWVVVATTVLAWITFASYTAWLVIGIARGMDLGIIIDLVEGEASAPYRLKEFYLDPVSGVTTWTQLAIVVGPLAVLRGKLTGRSPVPLVVALLVVAAARALLFSERLALLEVFVSVAIAWLVFRDKPPFFFRSTSAVLLSYASLWVGLIVFFGVFEYTRSWLHYYAGRFDGGIVDFAWQRLLGYYATAINNAALQGQIADSDFSFAFLLQGDLYATLLGPAGEDASRFATSLQTLSNPEFSNVSGLLVPGNALGSLGGLVFWVISAAVIGIVAILASRGKLLAILAYCTVGIGVLEIVRLFYYGTSRYLAVVICLLALALTYFIVTRAHAQETRILRRLPE